MDEIESNPTDDQYSHGDALGWGHPDGHGFGDNVGEWSACGGGWGRGDGFGYDLIAGCGYGYGNFRGDSHSDN